MRTTTKPAWMNGCECSSCAIAREMLEALEYVVAHPRAGAGLGHEPHLHWHTMQTMARLAIAKAKGELAMNAIQNACDTLTSASDYLDEKSFKGDGYRLTYTQWLNSVSEAIVILNVALSQLCLEEGAWITQK